MATTVISADGVANIASGATTITLSTTRTFTHIYIILSSGSSSMNLNFNPGATAATTDFLLASGGSIPTINFPASDGISAFTYYGNGTTGTISYIAW